MGGNTFGGTFVDPEKLEVKRIGVGALPVVNAVLGRLGFDELLSSYLPEPDPRCGLSAARATGVLVRNLAVGRQPLYWLCAWAAGYDAALLGLDDGETGLLDDDRVGRALDELFLADRASLVTALSLCAIRRFGIDVSELHNDSTSITLYGAYRDATGAPRGGVRPPVPGQGLAFDRRRPAGRVGRRLPGSPGLSGVLAGDGAGVCVRPVELRTVLGRLRARPGRRGADRLVRLPRLAGSTPGRRRRHEGCPHGRPKGCGASDDEPADRQAMRISSETADFGVWVTSQATWSSKS
ncbi:MAG: DUF4277 domain-containing protein [Actinomycetota bacterium]|nr:DUF4277 domain-containing protein [Actinomycetota bacterium]